MIRRALLAVVCVHLTVVAALAQSSVAELNDAGWTALQAGNGERAARFFNDALTMRPDDPVLLFGSGAALQAQGRPREAIARLKKALELNPRLTAASQLLGEVAYHEGEEDLAIRTYEDALKYAPGDARLTARLADWRKDADVHARFESREYDRFKVMFEGRAEESLARDATRVLNSAFWRIGQKLGAYPSDAVVTILYTEKQFRDITRAPEWSGGVFDGRIRIPVAGASREPALFERVLTHELTHAMIASIAPANVPTWLHEGLAQYFEGADRDAARRRVQSRGRAIPLNVLEGSFMRMNAADAQLAYDESLLAVATIFDRPTFGWTRLLTALEDGQPCARALQSFGFSYADLEAGFTR